MYEFIGKKNQIYKINIKLNANCPDSEKSGTGPGSCGGKNAEGSNSSSENSPAKTEKKGGFLSKLFGGGEKSSIKSISWKQARELSTDDLTKSLEEHMEIAKNGSEVDKKAALSNISHINEVLNMRNAKNMGSNRARRTGLGVGK